MKMQILLIHGGMTFKNKKDYFGYLKSKIPRFEEKQSWSGNYLTKRLPKHQFIRPHMPCKENAKYEEWKVTFETYLPHLHSNIILSGNSLGGTFLAKYLSEHSHLKKIAKVILICPPFDNSLDGEDLVGGFTLKQNLSKLDAYDLTLCFSEDDPVVPISHADKFAEKLPKSQIIKYKDKNGHFQVETFPQIIKLIKE